MEIRYFDELASTQKYLVEAVKNGDINGSLCVVARRQTDGIGSKNNSWEGVDGNLFFSFAMPIDDLPVDLPRQSICIYLLFIFKECLKNQGSAVKIKWPNDLYLDGKKVCGAMTSIIKNTIVCGIGLNTKENPSAYGKIDIEVDQNALLADYFDSLKVALTWEAIFSKYSVEFSSNKREFFGDYLVQGRSVELLGDGSLNIDGEKVFGIR